MDQQNELGIVIGSHQNLDTVASALALYLTLTQAGKKVQIISKKSPTVEVSNLVGVDRIKENFAGSSGKLVVALPYIKGEVEKVLFTEAPNTINFHLTAAPNKSITPFELSDVKLMWEGGAPDALITMGVGSVDELTGIADSSNVKIVNIDNYPGNTRFGDVVVVDETFSSLSEIIGKIVKDLQLPMDIDIAQNILDGVLYATRNFTKQNTSPLAFEAASTAMYHGAQRKAEEAIQQQPRRDQSFSENRQNNSPRQDRQNRDQRQQPQQTQQNRNRVSQTDFPAMHMQPRGGQQGQAPMRGLINENRRQNNPTRNMPPMQSRGQQQFGQGINQNDNRNKPFEENQGTGSQFNRYDDVQEAAIVEDNRRDASPANQTPIAPIEDIQEPEVQTYQPPVPEEVPDDWLMPKVFKSSKNNN